MNRNIGKILKESRISSGISVKEISDILVNKGYKASESTIYSWENENSQPTPGAFLVMCNTYGIKNVLHTFGYNGYSDDGSIQLNLKEIEHIEKYRALDRHGRETVSYILNRETERVKQINQVANESDSPNTPIRLINYYYHLASAGTGQIIFDMPPTKRIEIPDLPEYRKADYAIGVNGNSMEPTYYDGDTLLVEMAEEIEIGEIGIFSVNNECFVKKLGKTELISLNANYPNIPLNDTARCMGKVIDKLQKSM